MIKYRNLIVWIIYIYIWIKVCTGRGIDWYLPLWWGCCKIGMVSCVCRHWACAVIRLCGFIDVVVVPEGKLLQVIELFVESGWFLATISSTWFSSRDSAIMLATSWEFLPWRQCPFHSITSSPVRKLSFYYYYYYYSFTLLIKYSLDFFYYLKWPVRSSLNG